MGPFSLMPGLDSSAILVVAGLVALVIWSLQFMLIQLVHDPRRD